MAAAAARAARVLPFFLLACAVLALLVGPLATSVFVLGFIDGDSPCVLCWAQRTGMLLVALVGLFVLRFGPRPRYLGLAVLISAAGVYMGIRHSALHLARDVGQGFSVELYGAHTYTWSALVFWVCLVATALLIMLLRDGEAAAVSRRLGMLDRLAMPAFIVVVAGNLLQAFASTGPPPFMGQSDPVRFSFNPRHWVWSTEEWRPAPVSLRGRWDIEKPHVEGLPDDPDAGPLAGLPILAVTRRVPLALPLGGPVTDLAYDAPTDRFLLATENGVFLTSGALDQVVRKATVDMAFSVDLARFAAAAFLEPGAVMALSENKSFVILKENPRADAQANYRFFLDGRDQFDQVARSRLATVRARMMYVMSLAFDPGAGALYIVSVPNRRVKRLVVSRFDRADLTLSEEFPPALTGGLSVRLRSERSLDELYVTGLAWHEGRLYALSAAYGTLLVIDPAVRQVVAAYGIRGLDRPTGVAVKGSALYISGAGASVAVVALPGPKES